MSKVLARGPHEKDAQRSSSPLRVCVLGISAQGLRFEAVFACGLLLVLVSSQIYVRVRRVFVDS